MNKRYKIEKTESEVPCEHPLCLTLHKRFRKPYSDGFWYRDPEYGIIRDYHDVVHTYWIIIDTETGERAWTGEMYVTKAEAVKGLEWELHHRAKETA